MRDPIERQSAIDTLDVGAELLRRVLDDADVVGAERAKYEWGLGLIESYISDMKELPSAQPTLYGYEIEHLAYIARVMQKEGVTAEYAVRTFDDMSRALRMIIEEVQERVEKSLSAMPWMSEVSRAERREE